MGWREKGEEIGVGKLMKWEGSWAGRHGGWGLGEGKETGIYSGSKREVYREENNKEGTRDGGGLRGKEGEEEVKQKIGGKNRSLREKREARGKKEYTEDEK